MQNITEGINNGFMNHIQVNGNSAKEVEYFST
jgi:hypothetical protein